MTNLDLGLLLMSPMAFILIMACSLWATEKYDDGERHINVIGLSSLFILLALWGLYIIIMKG